MHSFLYACIHFFPALFLAVFALFCLFIDAPFVYIAISSFTLLFARYCSSKFLSCAPILIFICMSFANTNHENNSEFFTQTLTFSPVRLDVKKSFFSQKSHMLATIISLSSNSELIGQSCSIITPKSLKFIEGGAWSVEGVMSSYNGKYYFKPHKGASFTQQVSQSSLYDIVESTKRTIQKLIRKNITTTKARALSEGLLLGSCQNHVLCHEYRTLGLSHALAISGLHFSTIALVLSLIISRIAPKRVVSITLLIFFWYYWSVIGASVSVFRAYTMYFMLLMGGILSRRIDSLNRVCWAVLVIILFDSSLVYSLGFQFSFGATFALICFSKPIEDYFNEGCSSKKEKILISIIAANLAVHIMVIPISLWHFGSFPLVSLFINIFYPPLICGLLILLIICIGLSSIPYASSILWILTDQYAKMIIDLALAVPYEIRGVQLYLNAKWLCGIWLIAAFCLGVFLKYQSRITSKESVWETIV